MALTVDADAEHSWKANNAGQLRLWLGGAVLGDDDDVNGNADHADGGHPAENDGDHLNDLRLGEAQVGEGNEHHHKEHHQQAVDVVAGPVQCVPAPVLVEYGCRNFTLQENCFC